MVKFAKIAKIAQTANIAKIAKINKTIKVAKIVKFAKLPRMYQNQLSMTKTSISNYATNRAKYHSVLFSLLLQAIKLRSTLGSNSSCIKFPRSP